MTDIDQLPLERDLPADRHARLRARVLTMIAEPAGRRRTMASRRPVRIVAAGLAAAVCAAIASVIGGPSGSGQQPEVYALGDGVLSPSARETGRECLTSVRDKPEFKQLEGHVGHPVVEPWPADSPPRLLNHIEQQGRGALVIYQTKSQLIYCEMTPTVRLGPEPREFTDDGSWAFGVWVQDMQDGSQWLPGLISPESRTSTDVKGGYVQAAGRISERVGRVVLDDGAGHQSTARLAQGTFVVFSDGRVKTGAGMLISYDASGQEIDRRPALTVLAGRCYTDPAGNLVNPTSNHEFELAYKSSKARCKPAEPWTRRNSNSSQPTPQ